MANTSTHVHVGLDSSGISQGVHAQAADTQAAGGAWPFGYKTTTQHDDHHDGQQLFIGVLAQRCSIFLGLRWYACASVCHHAHSMAWYMHIECLCVPPYSDPDSDCMPPCTLRGMVHAYRVPLHLELYDMRMPQPAVVHDLSPSVSVGAANRQELHGNLLLRAAHTTQAHCSKAAGAQRLQPFVLGVLTQVLLWPLAHGLQLTKPALNWHARRTALLRQP
eukprot:365294-Chlamydomonas_euryale.AAC.5